MSNIIITGECTFEEIANQWLDWKRERVKESSLAVYDQCLRKQILPDLGHVLLADLTESTCNELLKRKIEQGNSRNQSPLSWKTVSDMRSVLHMVLLYASNHGFPQLAAIHLTLKTPMQSDMQVLTWDEQSLLMEYLVAHLSSVNLGILIAMFSGLRIGELCGLRWSDFDFRYGIIRVSRTVIRIRDITGETGNKTKLKITNPKTAHSIRTIPIPSDIITIIEPLCGDQDSYLLTGTHQFMEPRRLHDKFKAILKTVGLPDYRFHALRHAFASRCIEQNFDIKTLSEIMGHSSVKITMDRYVHPSLDFKKMQMDRLTLPKSNKSSY